MQNQISAKLIVKQLIQNVAKKIPTEDLQRLTDLYILIDRLEDRIQQNDGRSSHATGHTHLAAQYPEMWSKRTKLRPKQTTFKN
ncbi:hypothetical protein F7P75_10010 [Acinetobacter gandensis]|uniref:Uncharacterized protein n=1 Tax=Acinetobacter gandensis TaxID=1443941 RepID=A0A1A7R6R3_9GAMM|nr:hypothetical protein [Acinetobacter gandensis]KAB0625896.1 hypothetical protein F7P75_10010 [Acinetobacter gandensis]OBX27950.1 hypothetical protein A9J31_07435 [Acinetobacter gandensis]